MRRIANALAREIQILGPLPHQGDDIRLGRQRLHGPHAIVARTRHAQADIGRRQGRYQLIQGQAHLGADALGGHHPTTKTPLGQIVGDRQHRQPAIVQMLDVRREVNGLVLVQALRQVVARHDGCMGLAGDTLAGHAGRAEHGGHAGGHHAQGRHLPGFAVEPLVLDAVGGIAQRVIHAKTALEHVGHVDHSAVGLAVGHKDGGGPAAVGPGELPHACQSHLFTEGTQRHAGGHPLVIGVAARCAVQHESLQALDVDLFIGQTKAKLQDALPLAIRHPHAAQRLQQDGAGIGQTVCARGGRGPFGTRPDRHGLGAISGAHLVQAAAELAGGTDLDADAAPLAVIGRVGLNALERHPREFAGIGRAAIVPARHAQLGTHFILTGHHIKRQGAAQHIGAAIGQRAAAQQGPCRGADDTRLNGQIDPVGLDVALAIHVIKLALDVQLQHAGAGRARAGDPVAAVDEFRTGDGIHVAVQRYILAGHARESVVVDAHIGIVADGRITNGEIRGAVHIDAAEQDGAQVLVVTLIPGIGFTGQVRHHAHLAPEHRDGLIGPRRVALITEAVDLLLGLRLNRGNLWSQHLVDQHRARNEDTGLNGRDPSARCRCHIGAACSAIDCRGYPARKVG